MIERLVTSQNGTSQILFQHLSSLRGFQKYKSREKKNLTSLVAQDLIKSIHYDFTSWNTTKDDQKTLKEIWKKIYLHFLINGQYKIKLNRSTSFITMNYICLIYCCQYKYWVFKNKKRKKFQLKTIKNKLYPVEVDSILNVEKAPSCWELLYIYPFSMHLFKQRKVIM